MQPNPRLGLAREGVKKAVSFQADLILAVGGGSVIDTAKAVALEQQIREQISGASGWEKRQ